jgi:hypothetical protein
MVAGVQAGRISAVVFMFVRVLPLMAAGEAAAFDMGREKLGFKKIPPAIGQVPVVSRSFSTAPYR